MTTHRKQPWSGVRPGAPARLVYAVAVALLAAWGSLSAVSAAAPPARSLATDSQCFRETNQCVQGRFLEYWRSQGLDLGDPGISERESLALFGYPLSPEFTQRLEDGQDYVVQYFERARFEHHPEHQPPHDVLLGQLGRLVLAAVAGAPTAPVPPIEGVRYFPETGHTLSGRFRVYWEMNGGLAQFGYPLTEPFTQVLEGGQSYTVQYFERARFEHHPEHQGTPYEVLLGQFGRRVLAAVPTAPDPASDNVFATILGPADAPPLWAVRPCAGDGPRLCILADGEQAGGVELSLWHLETLPDLQQLLSQQGLTPGSIDYRNAEQAPRIAAAMRDFVAAYHRTVEEDRRATYGSTRTYTRLATQEASVGAVPGVRYGFVLTDQAGTVRERWLSFAVFDGTLLSILVAHYDPSAEFSFRSDEELRRFEPYLPPLIAGLRLPLPVQATSVRAVVTQGELPTLVPVFRFYSVGSNPVAELPPGQTLQVTGQSPNQRWWRVVCPNDLQGECWVSADPRLTQPKPA